jgi:hypothetical protein
LDDPGLFTRWTDPVTGVTSHILTRRAAPLQQSFYFTNRSFSADGRYLWFYCAHPPSGNAEIGRTLGVADCARGTVAWFPDTAFRDGSPFVDPATGQAYWCWEYSVYRRGPLPGTGAELVNSIPESVHKNRYGKRLATHLTRSADGREFLLDAHLGREWCLGSLPLDGSPFQVWRTCDRCYNHAQFSPTDPDLALVAQDWWIDVADGARHPYDNRIWLLRRGGELRPLFAPATSIAHEWWDPDGQHIWYVDYQKGTAKVQISSGRSTSIWPRGTCHSHATADGRFLVGDIGTYTWPTTGCRVAFWNVATGKERDIVAKLPLPPYPRGAYHIDPHPQFCLQDTMIVYTTTVLGAVDVALVQTRDLIDATG